MSELPKNFDAKEVEEKWYQFWKEGGFFHADETSDKPSYAIVIPPPNVTGVLHMGHALVNTLQDILIRWKRMSGYEALWVPGTDHAGISTQTVVERHLIKTEGKRRKDFDRETFLKHVWDWKEKSEHRIIEQLQRLGCSCDWQRQRFTMDEGNNQAVRTVFKKMFDDGLIYRGDYLVNWDPVTQTALADDEVEYEERQGSLWYFKYPLSDGSGHVQIATTRPETMLGDTAVAVNPKDERYKHLIGKTINLPLMNREIPVVADPFVDLEFGTGCVKITPAHDPNDNQVGQRHDLPLINIMTPDGLINENGGEFAGLSMAEGRKAVVAAMENEGLLEKVEPHTNRVGVSYRSKATIEPYMSKQWFVRMSGFAKKLRAVVEEGRVAIAPKNWESTYFHWIDNLRDWCISRQLWWGHRIPIWYHKENPERMLCYDGEGMPPEVEENPEQWTQDDDVLDTWFSSALWPFATLGWPANTAELERFYPNSVLVTGHDILFFWVARMIFMGEYVMGEAPFPETFLHGLIYGKSYWRNPPEGGIAYVGPQEQMEFDLGKPTPSDVHSKWEKMSKSKGNVIDPLEVIDQYGCDAVRMALCASCTQARQIDLDRRRFEEFKNFTNKVWNGARFVLMNLGGDQPLTGQIFTEGLDEAALRLEDRWILSVLNRTVRDVTHMLENYTFDQAALRAYDFFWKEFCAYYVEISKPILFGKSGTEAERRNKQKLLAIVLLQSMRLLHPMAPFVTEELFQKLKDHLGDCELKEPVDLYTQEALRALKAKACIEATYPMVLRPQDIDDHIEGGFSLVSEIIYTIRNIRGEMKVPPGTPTDVFIVGQETDPKRQMVHDNQGIIEALIKAKSLQIVQEEPQLGFCSTGIIDQLKVMIPLPEEMKAQEHKRLLKEKEKLIKTVEKTENQLANESFRERAPAELIQKQESILNQTKLELTELESKLQILSQ